MLDTGHHTVIRGNVEYDRFTGEVYDYLNFFPLYIGYARQKQVDMPGVEVLDRAGIPLLIDRFKTPAVFQSFQLFQRGVRWSTLQEVLKRKFSSKSIFSMLEGATPSYDSLLEKQTQAEMEAGLKKPQMLYFDFFLGRVDHEGHATSEPWPRTCRSDPERIPSCCAMSAAAVSWCRPISISSRPIIGTSMYASPIPAETMAAFCVFPRTPFG
jgi:hypothetical protein